MIDDIMMQAEERMEKALGSLGDAFASVRTGRANAMVLDRIRVDYYGVPTPVNQMAGVKTPDAHMLVIEPWDKGVLGAIEHAILQSDLGVTPSNDGSVIRLPFPALTEERRPLYRQADFSVDTSKLSPLQVVEEILHYLKTRGVVHA